MYHRLRFPFLMFVGCFVLLLHELSAQTALPITVSNPVRMAIIPLNPATETLADLLTVELTSRKEISLVERADFQKILREQSLSLANGNTDFIKAGQSIGASGLLLIDLAKSGSSTNLNVRLVAVRPGVVLISKSYLWPVRQPAEWSSGFIRTLEPLVPKLSILSKDAIPISILNLRSSVQTASEVVLEKQLTFLAVERFTREKQVFVLERRHLGLSATEKDYLGGDDSPFWNGSYLLEGTLDRDGVNPTNITLDARLVPPNGAAPISFSVSAARTNAASVIDHLAEKVFASLQIKRVSQEWSSKAESERYLEEAKWALKWSAALEAQAAADAAWSLGLHNADSATVKIYSHLLDLPARFPDMYRYQNSNPNVANHPLSDFTGPRSEWGKNFSNELRSMIRWTRTNYQFNFYKNKSRFEINIAGAAPPKLSQLALLNDQTDFYLSAGRGFDFGTNGISQAWQQLGMVLLRNSGAFLQHAHFGRRFLLMQDSAPALAQLRGNCRRVSDYLESFPKIYHQYYPDEKLPEWRQRSAWEEAGKTNLFTTQVELGCFWQDHPDDAIALYKKLMGSELFNRLHYLFWVRPVESAYLVGWNLQEEDSVPEKWEAFRKDLLSNKNARLVVEGMVLNVLEEHDFDRRTAELEKIPKYILDHYSEFTADKGNIDSWVLSKIMDQDSAGRDWFSDKFAPVLAQALKEGYENTHSAYNSSRLQGRRIKAMRENAILAPQETHKLFEPDVSRWEAEQVTPFLKPYLDFIAEKQKQKSSQLSLVEMDDVVSCLKHYAQKVDDALKKSSEEIQADEKLKLANSRASLNRGLPPKPTETPELSNLQWVPIPFSKLGLHKPDQSLGSFLVSSWNLVNNNLYLELHLKWWYPVVKANATTGQEFLTNLSYDWVCAAALDLDNSKWEITPYPEHLNRELGFGFIDFRKRTLFLQDGIFISSSNALTSFNFSTRKWTTMVAPWEFPAELSSVQGRIYAVSSRIIAEVIPASNDIKLLASTRRKPALNSLDAMEDLSWARFIEGAAGSPDLMMANKMYSLSTSNLLEQITNAPPRNPLPFFGLPKDFQVAPGLEITSSTPQVLFQSNSFFIVPLPFRTRNGPIYPWKPINGKTAAIYKYRPSTKVPSSVIIEFGTPPEADEMKKPLLTNYGFGWGKETYLLFSTNKALLLYPTLPGIWMTPRTEFLSRFEGKEVLIDKSNRLAQARTEKYKEEFSKNPQDFLTQERLKAAFDDPPLALLIASLLDTNHVGFIQPKSLFQFDLNHDGILQWNEEENILLANDLFAWMAVLEVEKDHGPSAQYPGIAGWLRVHKGNNFMEPSPPQTFRETALYFQKNLEGIMDYETRELTFNRFPRHSALGLKNFVEDYWKAWKLSDGGKNRLF